MSASSTSPGQTNRTPDASAASDGRTPLTTRRRVYIAVMLMFTALPAPGYGTGGHDSQQGGDETDRVTRRAQEGPVTLTLSAPGDVELPRHARVRVDVTADQGVTVSECEYDRALTEGDRPFEYRIISSGKDPAQPTEDGRLRWTQHYELEFVLPGEYELPAASVSFVDMRSANTKASTDAAPPDEQTLTTDPLIVTVRAPNGVQIPSDEVTAITRLDPIELPAGWRAVWWLAPLAGGVLLVVVVMLLRRARRQRTAEEIRIPAHEWARRELAALVADDLIAKGLAQVFHYRISGVVRGYIERRFGVSAAEMTTEEFLAAALRDARFGETITDELNRFLGACDLVKYARHDPGHDECDAVLKAAGDFVEKTRIRMDQDAAATPMATDIEERAA